MEKSMVKRNLAESAIELYHRDGVLKYKVFPLKSQLMIEEYDKSGISIYKSALTEDFNPDELKESDFESYITLWKVHNEFLDFIKSS